ncbi:hypothetical protein RM530_03385 [Algiphilus sp. W345]|uniref:Uncharacterized protein n=1 Tax=Banduia mediterranea TaxID=3075609 RepID=A0ABU2WFX2_9GAMM|nr:hypothetical protein [Algiphilus sp. W345]MDT0496408.1 hypothetical protein [Algiphilus sp. W345]
MLKAARELAIRFVRPRTCTAAQRPVEEHAQQARGLIPQGIRRRRTQPAAIDAQHVGMQRQRRSPRLEAFVEFAFRACAVEELFQLDLGPFLHLMHISLRVRQVRAFFEAQQVIWQIRAR